MSDAKPVPKRILRHAGVSGQFQLLALIHAEIARTGITMELLSKRTGRTQDSLESILSGDKRLDLNTASDMLFAISGAMLKFGPSP